MLLEVLLVPVLELRPRAVLGAVSRLPQVVVCLGCGELLGRRITLEDRLRAAVTLPRRIPKAADDVSAEEHDCGARDDAGRRAGPHARVRIEAACEHDDEHLEAAPQRDR